ncbi:MAG: phospho-sugar mutase [Oscillospiraceae bacterium]|nr:phospho-sugar mutase [Oscillospiraceae bacterium]
MSEYLKYKHWLAQSLEDSDLAEELAAINGDDEAVKDRFYRDLEFGTAGLRGVIGAGTNRMNIYTIRRATQGLAEYLNSAFKDPSVAISYDSRIKSDVFAREAARVLAANDIHVHLYKELHPVPCLSFATRELHCNAGIMVTASHNPAKYNGYKVYGSDGCQMTNEAADAVLERINKLDLFTDPRLVDFDAAVEAGNVEYIPETVLEKYLDCVQAQSIHPELIPDAGLRVVYTPLNGAGNKPVRKILDRIGVKDVHVVKEQEKPDGEFPTCPFPNPEIKEALTLGLRDCAAVKPDLLLATDPDADRMGIAVPDENGEYVLITGNEVGALLLEYICRERQAMGTMPEKPIAVKTIVSTKLADKIAADYGVELINVLTGFKYIGEQIGLLEEKGESSRYLFGFEESYGYLSGTYVRDKDAVVASMLICEAAAFYKSKGISLLDAFRGIYKKYGYYYNCIGNFGFEGAAGMEKMAEIMARTRENAPKEIGGLKVLKFADYKASKETDLVTGEETVLTLPKSDVLVFEMEQGAGVIIRPSGTEPKIKVYYTTTAASEEEAKALQKKLADDFTGLLA